jgi:hypothetical protein
VTALVHYLAVIGLVAAAALLMWLLLQSAQLLWGAVHDWQREREWRASARRVSAASRSSDLVPLTPAVWRPALGARVFVLNDAIDPLKGGISCEVALVDDAGVVHRGVHASRIWRDS